MYFLLCVFILSSCIFAFCSREVSAFLVPPMVEAGIVVALVQYELAPNGEYYRVLVVHFFFPFHGTYPCFVPASSVTVNIS